ncbi:hypothetical protein ACVD0V_30505, partial [Pseudomonas aeruginosa]
TLHGVFNEIKAQIRHGAAKDLPKRVSENIRHLSEDTLAKRCFMLVLSAFGLVVRMRRRMEIMKKTESILLLILRDMR